MSLSTVALGQLGLRKFFRFLLDEEEITIDSTAKVKRVKFRNKPQPVYSTEEETEILKACKSVGCNGVRNRAIITVFSIQV